MLLVVILAAVIAFVTGFFGETGKQAATPSRDASGPTIHQQTEGNQSPAVISDRDVTITYGQPEKPEEKKKD